MPDYKAVLSKTISALGDKSTPELRGRIYEKSRVAITKQLQAVAGITDERMAEEKQKLEDAIAGLESEITGIPVNLSIKARDPEPATEPVSEPVSEVVPEPTPEPEPGPEAVEEPAPAPEPEAELPVAPKPAEVELPKPFVPGAAPKAPEPAPIAEPEVEIKSEPVVSVDPIPTTAVSDPLNEPAQVQANAGDMGEFPDEPVVAPAVDPLPGNDEVAPHVEPLAGSQAMRSNDAIEREKPGLKLGWILLGLVLFLFGGGVFAANQNKEAVVKFMSEHAPSVDLSLFGFGESKAEAEPEKTEVAKEEKVEEPEAPKEPEKVEVETKSLADINAEKADADDKFAARLGSDGNTTVSGDTPADTSATDAAQTAETEAVDEKAPEAAQTTTLAQRAYYYVEGDSSSDVARTDGAVFWRNGERDGLPTIEGNMSIDDLGLKAQVIISKNTSAELSASHLIEVLFEVSSDFDGESIDAIGRPLFKPSEEASGTALMSQVAKIADGQFFVALFQAQEARDVNEPLISQLGWMGIPASLGTGRRVLINLEKGALGDQVFAKALLDWSAADQSAQ